MNTQPIQDIDQSSSGIKLRFRPDIEGLRAVAILLVIFSHLGSPIFPSGFIGVDVFFVLSGYLITGLLLQEIRTTGHIRFSRFYARRARRLLPAAMLLVVAVCLVEAVVINPFEQYRVLKAALATLLYSSNFYFAHLSVNYFDRGSAINPLLHTWSLAVEEQFYLVWPILLLLLARARNRSKTILLALLALAVVSFAFCMWYTSSNPMSAFFSSPARVWEFCLGALLVLTPETSMRSARRSCSWLGIGGFTGLLLCAQWIRSIEFPGFVAILPALGTMAVLLAGAGAPSSPVPRLLSTSPAQAVGGLSYSLYLWHWPALVVARQLFPSGSLAVRLAALAVAVTLAAITHWLIENPIRFHPVLGQRAVLTLGLGFLSAFVVMSGIGLWRSLVIHSAQYEKFDKVSRDMPALYQRGCSPQLTDPRPRFCSFGELQSPRSTVVLFGDSHAAEWFPALEAVAERQHWKLITLVKPGCLPLRMDEEVWPIMERVCATWWRDSIQQIRALHPDLVVISCASLHAGRSGQMLTDVGLWQGAAHTTFAALTQPGMQIRFLRSTPQLTYNVTECIAQAEWNGRTQCPAIDPSKVLYPEIYAAVQQGAADMGSVRFIDLTDRMCNSSECYSQVGDTIVYRDGDHLTATFNRSLAGVLEQRLIGSLGHERLGRF